MHADKNERNGSEQRLQCEGHLWRPALEEWLKEEAKEEKTREQAAPVPNAERQRKDTAQKKRKAGGSIAEPQKPDARTIREVKLRMGLNILLELVEKTNEGVLATEIVRSEPGCEDLYTQMINPENTSLLISVPRKLEPYPGRTGGREWMGRNSATRFHAEQRATVPADGAAPAAQNPGSQQEVSS
jgi:hypothetical protein